MELWNILYNDELSQDLIELVNDLTTIHPGYIRLRRRNKAELIRFLYFFPPRGVGLE